MKTLAEQVRDLENTRAAKAAEAENVINKSVEEDRTITVEEQELFDELEGEIKQIDDNLVRLKRLESIQKASAKPPTENRQSVDKSIRKKTNGPLILSKKFDPDDKFQGQSFIRKVIAKTLGKIDGVSPVVIAEKRWGQTNPNLVEVLKADVAGGGTESGDWGNELVGIDNRYTGDFVEFLYGMTVYNQLGLRVVPAHISIKGQDGAATGYWVGEGKAIPMSALDFNTVNLTPLKVAAITTMSKELMRHSSPSAEMLVRDALAEACSQRIDTTFISNTAAGTATPAGIMYNIAATTSAGTDTDGVINDIKELRQRFITAKNTGGLTWVMNKGLASSLSLLRNALGQKEFTEINQDGGMLEGDPVVTGDNVNANHLILIKPSDIWRIEDMGIEVSASEQATIEQADNPTGASDVPTDQSQGIVGMFQTESVAVKAVMPINFQRRRESAVAWINDADYGGGIST